MKILAIDIGGTNIKYAYMLEDSSITSRGSIPTPQTGREELIAALTRLFKQEPGVQGIAISMPGIIDADEGYCAMGGALRYNDDFYLRHELFSHCPVRIVMDNDAKCAATAEATVGALKDVSDGFVLLFGTMIGGGIIKNHVLHRGPHFSAGEVSYIITSHDEGPTCEGVWGNQCGTPALCANYAKVKGVDPDFIDGVKFFEAVNSGESEALDCLDHYAYDIAVQIFNIQNIVDPERFAIGGGISAQPAFIEAIRANLQKLYATCPYFVSQAEVVSCKFQNDANLVGALQCYLRGVDEREYFVNKEDMDGSIEKSEERSDEDEEEKAPEGKVLVNNFSKE
ncbi:ROK family protein [Bifidobacterium sp. ESL0784]|uniref:ROK family protein n=1 Tax=Bifidobacterium sp. ESL0784 TaxID=2983231 RepID=UPI0023F71454|nr:ROK family protein [Bifidobacterium sp. ESL0784]MDF7640682.1 ROK family protein [Bifidobacterium sp. ESL0784]